LRPDSKYRHFECREPSLSNYFNNNAKRDVERAISACYILQDENDNIIGYFTLSQHSVKNPRTKDEKGNYPDIPTTMLGRFAIANDFCGKELYGVKYSRILMHMALEKHIEHAAAIGSTALMLNPINDTVKKKFYDQFGIFDNYPSIEDLGYIYATTKRIKEFLATI
jgi:predicted GNAT family N-acyltransferase